MSDLFWLTDEQMARLQPYFLKSHGRERVDERRALSGIIVFNRNGLRWRNATLREMLDDPAALEAFDYIFEDSS